MLEKEVTWDFYEFTGFKKYDIVLASTGRPNALPTLLPPASSRDVSPQTHIVARSFAHSFCLGRRLWAKPLATMRVEGVSPVPVTGHVHEMLEEILERFVDETF